MTKQQAQEAMDGHLKVQGGTPGTDEYDAGYITSILSDTMATVGWDSGVDTPCPLAELSLVG
jgi:hypothetical protein